MKIATKEKIGVKPIRILWEFAEDETSIEIQVIPCGEWEHAVYGPMRITAADITEFVRNFNAGIRNDIPITEGHEVMEQKPAIGWFRELYDRGGDGLYAKVEWNEKGQDLL